MSEEELVVAVAESRMVIVWREKICCDKRPGSSRQLRERIGNARSVSASSEQRLL